MIWLIIASLYFSFKGRPVLGGFTLAAATLIKVFPITLLMYFIIRKQWRQVIATFAGLVLLGLILPSLVFGWQKNTNYLHEWVDLVAGPALHSNEARSNETPLYKQLMNAEKPRNQSLESLFLTAKVTPEKTRYLVAISGLVMLGVMFWIATRELTPQGEIALASAFLVWHLLIPPISETHYFGVLLLPLVLIANEFLNYAKDQTYLKWIMLASAFLLINIPFGTERMEMIRPLCWDGLIIWFTMIRMALTSASTPADETEDYRELSENY